MTRLIAIFAALLVVPYYTATARGPSFDGGTGSGAMQVITTSDQFTTLTASIATTNVTYILTYAGTAAITLPPAVAGYQICAHDTDPTVAGIVAFIPFGTNIISLYGDEGTAGQHLNSPGDLGDYMCLLGINSTTWITLYRHGSWFHPGV